MSAKSKDPAPSINPKRGEIWRVNLDPVVGAEMEKARPVVVLSLPKVGRPTLRLCAPITDWKLDAALLYWCVTMADSRGSGLRKLSLADVSQMRALDLRRFEIRLGKAHPSEVEAMAVALARITGYLSDPDATTTEAAATTPSTNAPGSE